MADGRLDRNRTWGKLLETVDHPPVVGVLLVHLVDDDQGGELTASQLLPGKLRTDDDTGARPDHQQGTLGGAQRAVDIAGEVLESGCVEQVDLVVVPGQVRDRGADRDLALDLFGFEVERGVARVRASQPLDGPARVEHRLGQARFAVVAVPEQRNISDLLRVDSGHRFSLSKESVSREWGLSRSARAE